MTSDPKLLFNDLPQNEQGFKRWLSRNAADVLQAIGIIEGQTVLDYGCNRGVFAIPAARLVGEAGKVYGVDVNAKALAKLHRAASKIKEPINIETVLIEDKQNPLAWLTEQVDVILLYDVLQVINDQRALLHDLHIALKADGCLSVFPMHVGVEPVIALAEQEGLFTLKDRYTMLLNFAPIQRI